MSVEKECQSCGAKFSTPNRRSETVKFCSLDCKQNAGWVSRKCHHCKKTFQRKKSDLKRSGRFFCSRKCYHANAIGKPNVGRPKVEWVRKVCETCSTPFDVVPSRKDKAKYCSAKCQHLNPAWREANSKSQQAEKSWRWSGGKYQTKDGYIRLKKSVSGKERFDFSHRRTILDAMIKQCPDHPFLKVVRGEIRLRTEIEVHHIDRDRGNNRLSNLLAITKAAHARIHHKNQKPSPTECWPPNPATW